MVMISIPGCLLWNSTFRFLLIQIYACCCCGAYAPSHSFSFLETKTLWQSRGFYMFCSVLWNENLHSIYKLIGHWTTYSFANNKWMANYVKHFINFADRGFFSRVCLLSHVQRGSPITTVSLLFIPLHRTAFLCGGTNHPVILTELTVYSNQILSNCFNS